MIRKCTENDFADIYQIINDAAIAYKGIIPEDRWHDPYMPEDELKAQIEEGVEFYCFVEEGRLIGVMGIQHKGDVTLIRHAYVATKNRNSGIGSKLLQHLLKTSNKPVLIGTWKAATWAIGFYEKHGFSVVAEAEKNILLRRYWNIPDRQVETSVVLADKKFNSDN